MARFSHSTGPEEPEPPGPRAFRGLTTALDAPTKPRPGPQHRPRYVDFSDGLIRIT